MKLSLNLFRPRVAGFTLVEIFVVSFISLLLVLGITAVQLFAARVYTLAATKLTATAGGRKVMNVLRDQVRGSGGVLVGIYDPVGNTFSNIPFGTLQIGNALVISNANSTYLGTIYFMDPSASNISCVSIDTTGTVLPATRTNKIVVYVNNYYCFDAEDAFANIMTTPQNNRIIHVKFQFSQWEYPLAGVGGGALYDYYQLQTRVAPRIIQ